MKRKKKKKRNETTMKQEKDTRSGRLKVKFATTLQKSQRTSL